MWCYLAQGMVGERLRQTTKRDAAAKKIGKALEAKRFWRFWPSSINGGDLLLRRDFGLIRLPGKPFLARFNFRAVFANASDVLFAEPEHVAMLVARVEKQADFQEALTWLCHYEDAWSNVSFNRGSRPQLEALLRGFWALFRSDDSQFSNWIYSPQNQTRSTLVWTPPLLQFPLDEQMEAVKRRLFALINEEIGAMPAPQRRYSHSGEPEHMALPCVVATLPSMHDRIEALLTWREFLSDKLPREEIEALLPKL
ncbi:hypothetical protein EON80_31900 [bacterium]|nr:MAG: hypothetical protein EON80_31900 [bacterium]